MTKEEQDRVSGILVGIVIGIAVSNALLRLVLVIKIYNIFVFRSSLYKDTF